MRIKRIEIVGFKSFCDRTVLHFSEPVVGVVGPNGCGKSNIVDAIRWCMGEQSAKHLRGQAMGDVIFAGSDSRGPAGMAEVSLTFEDIGFSAETLELALDSELEAGVEGDENSEEIENSGATPEAGAAEDASAAATVAPEGAGGPAEATASSESGDPAEEIDPRAATKEVAKVLEDTPPAIDFSKYSEVTITRRLFRDGTSLYLLNKTPCRLRDITDFFLGTGVGTKAYSIIEQGRIGMIVSARANDRRTIIEEAAGITKFKTKRRAAERKLEQTRQNLLRVSDIVEELGKRLGSLRRQAQKAERYRRYRGEVRDIELWISSHQFLERCAAIKELSHTLEALRTEAAALRDEFAAADAALMLERGELATEEKRLSGAQEELYSLENRVRLSESKLEFQSREASEAEERASTAQGEIRGLVEQRDAAARDLEAQKGALAELREEVDLQKGRESERQEAAARAREELREGQERLDRVRTELSAARAAMARADSSRESLGRRREDADQRLRRVVEETAQANGRVSERERDVKRVQGSLSVLQQTRMDLGSKSDEFVASKRDLEGDVQRLEAEVETLRTELHRRRSRLQSLREIHDKYEGFARGTRAIMQNSGSLVGSEPELEIRGLVADVVNAPEKLEIAVEAALGDRLGGILVNRAEVGARAIQYLKETSAGRSAFVPFRDPSLTAAAIEFEDHSAHDSAPSGEGVFGPMVELVTFEAAFQDVGHSLLGDAIVVDSLRRALDLRERGCRRTLVTLDGDIVDGRGVVSGGSREASGASVLSQKREIRELDEIVSSLESDLADASARFVSHKSELLRVTKALEALRNQRHDGELAITAQEKDLANARAELGRLRERTAKLNSEQLEIEDRLAAFAREELEMGELHRKSTVRADELEREQLSYIEEVSEGRILLESISQSLTEARIKAAQVGEKRASTEAGVLRLERAHQELGSRIDKLQSSIAEDTRRAAELRENSAGLEETLVECRAAREALLADLSDWRASYEERHGALQIAEVEVRRLRERGDLVASEVQSRDAAHRDLVRDKVHLEETIEERYHVALATEVFDYHMRAPVTRADRDRLAERKTLIERMGSDINLRAIEEFAEISQRHDFLATQREDLYSAVGQLERAIAKINKTSRQLFRDTFDAINNMFQEMFPKLFRGGRAKLALTGGESVDILEAGVEIMAQPPGKKNVTVDQLSGGEKALTAVALLFSIFLIKPSPFCLLDEVDAPLDEANVDRYNEILRSMTDHSQFIVITHNKRTMSVADRLYGVTMQEPGVSKLVSVNLSRIGDEERAA